MYSGPGADKQFVFPKASKSRIKSDSGGDEMIQDTSWWMQVNLNTAWGVRDLRTPQGINPSVFLSNSVSPLPSVMSTVKFEDCQRSREVGFVSNDPNFSVRPDGTVYAEQEVSNLSEPVQFMVTAQGLHDPHVWETTVKLALAGHPHSLALTKVMKTVVCLTVKLAGPNTSFCLLSKIILHCYNFDLVVSALFSDSHFQLNFFFLFFIQSSGRLPFLIPPVED